MARSARRPRSGSISEFAHDRPGVVASLVVVLVLAVVAVAGKVVADRSADAAAQDRAAAVAVALDGAGPAEFLTYNAGTDVPGAVPGRLAREPDLESVVAGSQLAFLRFQPDGWWSAFAERCVVAEVREDRADVRVVKLACARVPEP